MKKAFSLLLAQLILAGVVTARSQSAPSAQHLPPPLSLTIRPINDVVQAGSPVDVQVTIKNISDHFAAYELWGGLEDFTKIDVRDSEGNQPLTGRGRAVLLGEGRSSDDIPSGSVVSKGIKPGETFTNNERVPGGIFDMTKPGTYTIQMRIPWGNDYMKSNVVTVTVVQGATPYVAPVQQPAISVTIRPASGASVFPGGQVAIEVITKNISNDWINERTAGDKRNLQRFFRVDVQDSQGGAPPETDFGRRVGNRGDTPYNPRSAHQDDMLGLHYDVGQERTQNITVSDLYDLSKPGKYTIQVRRWDDESKTWVKSNTVTVTVTP